MIEFIGTCVVVYFVFRFLDWIFRPKRPRQTLPTLKVGQSIVQVDGQYYVVEEVAEPAAPVQQDLPDNVVKFPKGGRHAN